LRAAAAVILSAALAGALCAAPAAHAGWSAPARPPGCATALPSTLAPLIVFPSSGPQRRSGLGVLVWDAPRGCPSGSQGAGEAFGASLTAGDVPQRSRPLISGAGDLAGVVAATGTTAGQVVVAGSASATMIPGWANRASEVKGADQPAGGGGALTEGRAVGAFSAPTSLGGPAASVSAFSGYLGDAVLASVVHVRRREWGLAVRSQRHYSESLTPPRLLLIGAAMPNAVAVTMDYRSDILVVWARDREIYAREIANTGAVQALHRLGGATVDPELRVLLSDDGRAIVAWREQSTTLGKATQTTIELSISGPNLSFHGVLPIERFRDPGGFAPQVGSLRLIRLSSEAVMMAWTGMRARRYVVRASPVSLRRGAWAPVTISTPGEDALLADLVPGPHAEALALWSAAPRLRAGGPDLRRRMILAAGGHYAGAGEVSFAAPEVVSPPGPNGTPAAAIDPQTGNALAAWVTLAGAARRDHVAYAVHTSTPLGMASANAIPQGALACCLGLALPYASIESSAIRIGTPLAACLK
jgi:hypothetical protein